ncbi:AAA family ATPase [Streptosporangiaceae bacterium NEAU-GS5]|nr:AAA family ATPase [Streptosporangiaceae bacterium NEAU-GS5]
MITRIEIDGFKSFENFGLDLPPFLVLIGTNASGKSNLVDALTFISAAGTNSVDYALRQVRGDAYGLFRRRGDGVSVPRMRFALEFALTARLGRWRYEVELVWGERGDGLEGIVLDHQRLHSVDGSIEIDLGSAQALRRGADELLLFPYRRSGRDEEQVQLEILTDLSRVRSFHLEAGALRAADRIGGSSTLEATGRSLPNYFRSLIRRTQSDMRPLGVVGDIKMHLVGLVREFNDFEVIEDDQRRDVRIEFASPYGERIGAEFASDGTLRLLALLAVLHDDGLALIEEPENGVFPERLRQLLAIARGRTTEQPGSDGLQVIMTSHSPVVLDVVPSENIVYFDMTTVIEGDVASRVTRARRLREPGGPAKVESERWSRVTDSELSRFRAGVEEPVG